MSIFMNDANDKYFHEKLDRASHEYIHLSSKAEIVSYYQANYPALGKHGSWKQHLVRDLSEVTGKKEKSLEKRFDGGPKGRLNNPEKKNAGEYKDLGKRLPPVKVPKRVRGGRVKVDAVLYFSGKGYHKNFDIPLDQDDIERMIETGEIDPIIEAYGINPEDVEEIFFESVTLEIW